MLDFLKISKKEGRKAIEIAPKFDTNHRNDVMTRGRDFYAVWNEEEGLWSKDESQVISLIDQTLDDVYVESLKEKSDEKYHVLYMWDSDSGSIDKWHKYVQKQLRDKYHILDQKIIFSNQDSKKRDYASKRLSYEMGKGDISAYEELMSTLYEPEERDKIEWAIGSIFAGDSKHIQKFIVLYGGPGTGKSTVLDIIQNLFEDYATMFDAQELADSKKDFALEPFKDNPLVAIQQDGDLSKIEDNTKLNSIVSHEKMVINEKFKSKYISKFNTFLFLGTNKPVKITEAKSGLMRRLIDVRPTGNTLPHDRYDILVEQIKFELGAIAFHCLEKYKSMGIKYYDSYVPIRMMSATNDIYDFIDSYYLSDFSKKDAMQLSDIYALYKVYCEAANIKRPVTRKELGLEMQNYYKEYIQDAHIDGVHIRNYYKGFLKDKFLGNLNEKKPEYHEKTEWLRFENIESIFDKTHENCFAQLANDKGTPIHKWSKCKTHLSDISTDKVHYVKIPDNEIVIDFDIKDESGNKSYEKNLEAALKWPRTYAELSKSGAGIHLHYIYDGDVSKLSHIFDDDIEIKVFTGDASLRRMLTKCNDIPIATISSGLPLKGDKKMINEASMRSEKQLRRQIFDCLEKKHHGATTPEIFFIKKLLDEADEAHISYDVTDLRQKILTFALGSTHQASNCLNVVKTMKFKSSDILDNQETDEYKEAPIIFYDVEVFPNLFLINWKYQGNDKNVNRMINPSSIDVEMLTKFRLIGFNCRRYDNHILYARMMGYNNEELYKLSQKIISGSKNAFIGKAYNLSYTDVYDFAAKKQSLKKWEIELGIHHQELGLKWDEPVPEELWPKVAEYCDNDVLATEAVFNHLEADFTARQILSVLSGLSVNDTTNSHTAKIIFGDDPHPQDQFVYTDLSKEFPGYSFDKGVSSYRGENPSEGGYVYAEPGMYTNVALLDVASLHPNSLIQLNLFGDKYTANFKSLLDARLYIKHKDYESAAKLFDGKLAPYLKDPQQAKALSYALKIVINSVYGLTSAKFDNKFRDIRNVDNIVAKRGALFMIELKHAVQAMGFRVAHIKTDSIKIPNATDDIIKFVMDFGKRYGYTFEHEATYEKMCLVNNAVYIAKEREGEEAGQWTATGAEFQHPYIFKTLFSHEPIKFEDMCETKEVKSSLYLDMNENLPEDEHNYVFIGRIGSFCPIKAGCNGGILYREKDGKYYAAGGTKGYRWLEAETVKELHKESDIDELYFRSLVDEAIEHISEFGDVEWFTSNDPVPKEESFIDITSDDLPF